MKFIWNFLSSSIARKYIMAATGAVLVGFVCVHLLGNLQIFLGRDMLNAYGYHLHALPLPVLWGFRIFLGACILTHVFFAIWLTIENVRARVIAYKMKKYVEAGYASLTMLITGSALLLFIIFHILNFTVGIIPGNYNLTISYIPLKIGQAEVEGFDVYAMLISAFSIPWLSLFYIGAMGLLCLHLSHGFSSMFQSFGLRNEKWRKPLDFAAMMYGWAIFLGFASIPLAVWMRWIQ
jgi:succinate dehydrogenase / fumarate reductase, cytochrome b subunit